MPASCAAAAHAPHQASLAGAAEAEAWPKQPCRQLPAGDAARAAALGATAAVPDLPEVGRAALRLLQVSLELESVRQEIASVTEQELVALTARLTRGVGGGGAAAGLGHAASEAAFAQAAASGAAKFVQDAQQFVRDAQVSLYKISRSAKAEGSPCPGRPRDAARAPPPAAAGALALAAEEAADGGAGAAAAPMLVGDKRGRLPEGFAHPSTLEWLEKKRPDHSDGVVPMASEKTTSISSPLTAFEAGSSAESEDAVPPGLAPTPGPWDVLAGGALEVQHFRYIDSPSEDVSHARQLLEVLRLNGALQP